MFYRDLFHLLYALQNIQWPKSLSWLEGRKSPVYILLQLLCFNIVFIVTCLHCIVSRYHLSETWTRNWLFFSLIGISLLINLWLMVLKKNAWLKRPAQITTWSMVRGALLLMAVAGFACWQFYF